MVTVYFVIASFIWNFLLGFIFNRFHITPTPPWANFLRFSAWVALTSWVLFKFVKYIKRTEAVYAHLIDVSPQPIFVYSDEKWVYANPAALEMCGAKTIDALLNRPIWELVHEDSREDLLSTVKHIAQSTRLTEILERKYVRLDREIIFADIRCIPCSFKGKRAVQVVCNDVTARKQAEEKLRETKELFESIFNYSTDAMAVFDLNAKIIKVNPGFERMFGYSQEELVGTLAPVSPADDVSTSIQYYESVKLGIVPYVGYQGKKVCKDGQTLTTLVTLSPIKDKDGHIIAVSGICKDITELKAAQDLLVKSEKLLAVGELAAGVAHEIRNPLTAVKGFVQLLSSSTSEKQTLYHEIIESELDRIEKIISEMLLLAKPQPVQYRPVDLNENIAEVVRLLRAQANMQNVSIVTRCDGDIPKVMAVDNHLKQVFINIVKNAIEAMPHGGALTVSLTNIENTVFVRFSDEGVGITEKIRHKIGDPFVTTKEKGTGLGLLVSKRIIANHNGALEISSNSGEGTTVTISLPVSFEASPLD
ncbi:PAS domain S-box protein [Alicyclobacillus fastidiosus]|uniref:histidine kinase n=1 Tax=Alicyclobacillus fastidiosus TaxID=392011 RepID=A0ABY6ZGL5_9BACL|nr:PAS domain S-box protein [Alicyclobacillus fastidiosus]WAH42049.1 PAS domain S-box protein [Alicyclobacillus fastidiosus]GMA63812.1 hypothetical protein GCM10025859_42520 [Alicyclobacillus fastidiosus]